jgi:murein DD-endopeptidase MepM/ murein hydrolase activator NlpD
VKKFIAVVVAVALFFPAAGLVSVAAVMNPAALSCGAGALLVGSIPDSVTARTKSGREVTLGRAQLVHAATVITVGARTPSVGREGVVIALIAALTESGLRMLSNSAAFPASANYPSDGDGSDHDSLGLFQMRPTAGWGSVAELMDPDYQARAFYGGPSGPNAGSPRGLLEISGWPALDPGEAAQAVEVSAFPDRYQDYLPVADAILTAMVEAPTSVQGSDSLSIPESSRIVFPLPAGSFTNTDSFGWREDPYTKRRTFHAGSDLAAPAGTPILAIADGVVTYAGRKGSFGGLIVVEHTVRGERVDSYYAHMWDEGIHVAPGDSVAAGQHIGDVGSAGKSTGSHLHLEIHPGGSEMPAVNAVDWLASHGAADANGADVATARCRPERSA